jgi:hypothetical protein
LGGGDTIGFFDDTIPKEAAHARALLLALLRDRRPGDGAYPPLPPAGYYLRLNPDDAEMREAWDGFVGRPPPAQKCAHNGFLLVEQAEESGCAVRCALCGMVGPVRETPEAARKALLVLGGR